MNGLRIIANESQQTMNINNQSITTRLFLFPEPNGPIIKKQLILGQNLIFLKQVSQTNKAEFIFDNFWVKTSFSKREIINFKE